MEKRTYKNLLSALQNQIRTDCSFEFEDKQTIKAHAAILGSASSVFDSMLFGSSEPKFPIPIKGISLKAFHQLLWTIYGRQFSLEKAEEACELYNAAKKFKIPSALKIARSFMLETADKSNVSQYHCVAAMFNDTKLLEKFDAIFVTAVEDITKQPNFFVSADFTSNENDLEIFDVNACSKLNVSLEEYKKSLEQEACKELRICKTLGLVRFMAMEVDKLFSSIVPESTTKLTISTNPVLSESDFESLEMFLTEVTERVKMVCSCSRSLDVSCNLCGNRTIKDNSNELNKLKQAIAIIEQHKIDEISASSVQKIKSIINDLSTIKLN